MDISTLLINIVFGIIGLVLFLNMMKVFSNILTGSNNKGSNKDQEIEQVEEDHFINDLRSEIDEKVRPHLSSLEGMYHKSGSSEDTLGAFVFSVVQDKLSDYVEEDSQVVKNEIVKYCSEYEDADCKESFCLVGSGLSCPQT